jgi:hypothetical protein
MAEGVARAEWPAPTPAQPEPVKGPAKTLAINSIVILNSFQDPSWPKHRSRVGINGS